jgi:hypothetical protein
MMVNIRNRVFETNSSSVHTVSYDKSNNTSTKRDKVYLGLVDDSTLELTPGEYGWGWESYGEACSKFSYVVAFCLDKIKNELWSHPDRYWPADRGVWYDIDDKGKVKYLTWNIDWNDPNSRKLGKNLEDKANQANWSKIVEFINLPICPDTTNKNSGWYGQCWQDLYDVLDIARRYNDVPFENFSIEKSVFEDTYIDHQSTEDFKDLGEWVHDWGANSVEEIILDDRYTINTGNDNEEGPDDY